MLNYYGNITVVLPPKRKENKIKEIEEKRKEIIDIFSNICTNLPKIQKITEKRKKAIDSFIKEFTKEQFESICEIANSSNFLTGDNDRKWKADFDFMMRIDKATAILEGKYSNEKEKKSGQVAGNSSKYANIDFAKNTAKYNGEKIDDTGLI